MSLIVVRLEGLLAEQGALLESQGEHVPIGAAQLTQLERQPAERHTRMFTGAWMRGRSVSLNEFALPGMARHLSSTLPAR